MDTGCGVSLVDTFIYLINTKLFDIYSNETRRNENACFKNGLLIITEYFPVNFGIPNKTVDGSQVIIDFTGHVYIIEKFKTKMLIKNDILNFEMMVPNIGENHLTIGNCKNMMIEFNMNTDPPIKRVVRSNEIIKIPAKFNQFFFPNYVVMIYRQGRILYSFEKKIDQLRKDGVVFFVDIDTAIMQIMNTSSKNVYLFKTNKLNIVQKILLFNECKKQFFNNQFR